MLCSQCGTFNEDDEIVCRNCGALLTREDSGESGAMAIRQGRRAREKKAAGTSAAVAAVPVRHRRGASHEPNAVEWHRQEESQSVGETETDPPPDEDDLPPDWEGIGDPGDRNSVERRRRKAIYEEGQNAEARVARIDPRAKTHRVTGHMINWTRVALISAVVALLAVIGAYLYLTQTGTGHRMLVRMGMQDRVPDSMALWDVGEEKLDAGDIGRAISLFEQAKTMDEEAKASPNVDGLLLLGSAYEADDRKQDAADLYQAIYEETPSRPEAYENHIRILLATGEDGDQARAGELMKLAYDKTGESKFSNQRANLLPAKPVVDLTAGYYETKKYVTLSSPQEFDVYYTFDENAELPAGGVKFTDKIFMDEGIYSLRAVAVNGELVSDELTGIYKIIMPSPQTPQATLAPNTYKNRQWVGLKPGKDNEKDDDIILYYTIDGSLPDADSPIFTPGDKKIPLPGGRVTLRAVAVNKYGKVSNTLEILYKIESGPFPLTAYSSEDVANGVVLYQTTLQEFQKQYGEAEAMENVSMEGYEDTEVRKYRYSWGYAYMAKLRTGWVLCRLNFTSRALSAPRGTGIGDSLSDVVSKFRDMGQVAGASGNRGLYKTGDNDVGKIWVQEDGGSLIRYTCTTADSHIWQLDYYTTESGIVNSIDMICYP